MQIFKIYKKTLALKLLDKGNPIIFTENNFKKPRFTVFCFEDNDKFRKDFNEIK